MYKRSNTYDLRIKKNIANFNSNNFVLAAQFTLVTILTVLISLEQPNPNDNK